MHIQAPFREARTDELHRFIRSHSLGTVILSGPVVQAQPLPMEIVGGGLGTLRTHLFRHNPLCKTMNGTEALAIFNGPNAYISPRWYVSGQKSGRVAPSWNYTTVHARGPARFIDDGSWLKAHLASLASTHEAGRHRPWSLDEAPPEFIDGLTKGLIGLEIEITALEGKYFLSQQRTSADRESIVRHLRMERSGSAGDVAGSIEAQNGDRPG